MRIFITAAFLVILLVPGWSQLAVDREELKKGTEVEFTNYTGPYDKIDTFEEIRGIGVYLGTGMTKTSTQKTYNGRYSIIHVYDPADTSGKLDADIFVIEPDGFIDHIRNVRTVLAGYLQSAYGYSYDDAILLAKFVTLYNAVFRGNVGYFAETYKPAVMRHMSAKDAGLATVYSEWPGRTKVLIPLHEGFESGKKSTIDTTQLTETEVKETLRKEEDMGVQERKEMVDLQEEQMEEKEEQLAQDKEQLEEEKQQLEEDKQTSTDRTEIAKREEQIKQEEQDIQRREEQIKQEQQQLNRDREQIATDERGIQEKRTDTTATETTTSLATSDVAVTEKGLFLKVAEGSENESGRIVLYNFKDDKLEASTQNISVKNRTVLVYSNVLLVVAEPSGSGASYLMLIDPKALTVSKQSQEEIYKNTILATQGSAIYAVVKKGTSYFIGKFDGALALTSRSQQEVIPNTPILISGSFLYVQARNGEILRLQVTDLVSKDTASVP